MDCTFPKSERIVSRKLITGLFNMSGSHTVVAFPIRAIYKVTDNPQTILRGDTQEVRGDTQEVRGDTQEVRGDTQEVRGDTQNVRGDLQSPRSAQILISVPKRQFRHAVDRNRVKRQIREAYRHNKHLLADVPGQQGKMLLIAFVWLSPAHLPSAAVMARVATLLKKIASNLVSRGETVQTVPVEP